MKTAHAHPHTQLTKSNLKYVRRPILKDETASPDWKLVEQVRVREVEKVASTEWRKVETPIDATSTE